MAVIKKIKGAAAQAKKVVSKISKGISEVKRIAREMKADRDAREKANNKKLKKPASKKAPAKGAKPTHPKRGVAAVKAKAKPLAKKKAPSKAAKATKRSKPQPKPAPVLTTGVDMHLIPVKGEIHPAGMQDSKQHEKFFHRHEEVALHQENQKAKAALATRKNIKTNFRNLRQP
jgi:hypothetical protein